MFVKKLHYGEGVILHFKFPPHIAAKTTDAMLILRSFFTQTCLREKKLIYALFAQVLVPDELVCRHH